MNLIHLQIDQKQRTQFYSPWWCHVSCIISTLIVQVHYNNRLGIASYRIFTPVPAARAMKNCFTGPRAFTARSPRLLKGTRGPLSTAYNLCNLSHTPSSILFAAYLSALYVSRDICTPISCP